jgi:hypothetical protein
LPAGSIASQNYLIDGIGRAFRVGVRFQY